jgi:dTDP-4-dehydrorhamnose 3,5-epimerase-like enzyme|tara:strand:- start:40 stop:501 length:462 start_codon:yes stop_codon:yes gene_type:complete
MNNGTKTLDGGVATDDRGCVRFVNDFDFNGVKRFYQVENHKRGFVRAWHGHKNEAKYVYVAKGSAMIGAVIMPPTSNGEEIKSSAPPPTAERFILSANKPQVLYIPKGFANGAMTLEEDTIIQYFSTSSLDESLGDDIRFAHDKWDIWKSEYR